MPARLRVQVRSGLLPPAIRRTFARAVTGYHEIFWQLLRAAIPKTEISFLSRAFGPVDTLHRGHNTWVGRASLQICDTSLPHSLPLFLAVERPPIRAIL